MSFILDALKKSETERQQQGSAEFSSVPTSSEKPNPARWLWLLAALLGINFAVLIGVLMRPEPTPTETVAEQSTQISNVEETTEAPASDEAASFEKQIAVAIEEHEDIEDNQELAPPRAASKAVMPTIDQLRLDGSLQLAEGFDNVLLDVVDRVMDTAVRSAEGFGDYGIDDAQLLEVSGCEP